MKNNIPDIGQRAPDFEVLNSNGDIFSLKKEMNLPFELLCDPDKEVVKRYHLLNPFEHEGIAYPAIFVMNPEGQVCYRSLDTTYRRVDLSEVLAFLDKLQDDSACQEQGGQKKAFIILAPGEMGQIMQNMIFRGSGADWKHYFKYTFVYTPKNLFNLVTKPLRKK